MRRDIFRACGNDERGIKVDMPNTQVFSSISNSSGSGGVKSSFRSLHSIVSQSLNDINDPPGDVPHGVLLPSPCLPARPSRPPSERLHLWKKVMKVHQDRQLRVCTHAQAQIQCRYAYLPKIGRHQNQTRSAGRSSPPVVDLYRQTHLARSELLRTPRHTSIYQGQFYP